MGKKRATRTPLEITRVSDTGTKEIKKLGIVIRVVDGELRAQRRSVSPCHLYFNRKQLSERQFYAAVELYKCWYSGVKSLVPSPSASVIGGGFGKSENSSPAPVNEAKVDSFKKYQNAIACLKNAQQRKIIQKVCLDEVPIVALYDSWRQIKKMKIVLVEALDLIADEFGF